MARRKTDVWVETLTDGTGTVARVQVFTDEFVFEGRGSSRRMPEDTNDTELGEILAVKRALETVVASMTAKAARLSEVNDKKAAEAANWRSKEQWEEMQELAKTEAKKSHPAGKALPKIKNADTSTKSGKTVLVGRAGKR